MHIFLIIIYVFLQIFTISEMAFAVEEKTSKIDVESLGLDNVDQKPAASAVVVNKVENINSPKKISETKPEEIANKKDVPPEENQPKESIKQLEKNPSEKSGLIGIVDKVQNFKIQDFLNRNKDEVKTEQTNQAQTADSNKKDESKKYINSEKKRNLKKHLAAEKLKKEHEKKRQENLVKLNELRKKYLIKINENNSSKNNADFDADDEKIIPRKKEINRFVSAEEPALPLMDRARASDNRHIPIQFTPQDDVAILFNAIAKGNVAFFNSAYKNVENPNIKNQLGDTILTCAALLQKQAIIASVLAKGADPDMSNELGYTPIDITIELLDIKSLELLADNNADVKYVDALGRTYLMHAARVGFLPAVELLVSKGVNVNAMDNDGFTALAIAYRHKKEVIVKYLLKNGAKTWIEKPYNPEDQSLIRELENRWK